MLVFGTEKLEATPAMVLAQTRVSRVWSTELMARTVTSWLVSRLAYLPLSLAMLPRVAAGEMPPPIHKASPPEPAALHSWTGFYAGLHGGYGATMLSGKGPLGAQEGILHGEILGGQIGYNYQLAHFVIGLEGDVSWSNLSLEARLPGVRVRIKDKYFATVAGRLGYAFDALLFYGKAGVAFTEEDWALTVGGAKATGNFSRRGLALGAGIEYAFTSGWSIKLEYNYLDFDPIREVLTGGGIGKLVLGQVQASNHIGKLGINLHF
jgi:outer membrane immunogenic protein